MKRELILEVRPRGKLNRFIDIHGGFFCGDIMKEIWKEIPGFEDYEASTIGRIRRKTKSHAFPAGYILKGYQDLTGYINIVLHKKQIPYPTRFHRVIAITFLGPPPTNKHEVNHKNGIKNDNNIDNLEWITHKENILHSTRILCLRIGEKHGIAKLKNKDIPIIRDLMNTNFCSLGMIAELFGVGKTTIWRIKHGHTWAHIK